MHLPSINWPTELREAGPHFDPSIILTGEAALGHVDYLIVAVRMDTYRTGPDYREGIDPRSYESEIEETLGALEFLTDEVEPALLPLTDGKYLLWMLPGEVI